MIAKCTVERLMAAMGLAGVRRGKNIITTVSDPKAPCPLDKVNREFRVSRPNALWVVDFTYVHTWAGFVYVAFVIDAYARRTVGWKVSTSATAGFVLDALEQAIHARRPGPDDGLIHHSDRGVQGGFNRSSQHLLHTVQPGTGRGLLRGSSNQAFSVGACSAREQRHRVRLWSADSGRCPYETCARIGLGRSFTTLLSVCGAIMASHDLVALPRHRLSLHPAGCTILRVRLRL